MNCLIISDKKNIHVNLVSCASSAKLRANRSPSLASIAGPRGFRPAVSGLGWSLIRGLRFLGIFMGILLSSPLLSNGLAPDGKIGCRIDLSVEVNFDGYRFGCTICCTDGSSVWLSVSGPESYGAVSRGYPSGSWNLTALLL